MSREESAKKLPRVFDALCELGQSVEILAGRNVDGVKNADVILLWWVVFSFFVTAILSFPFLSVANLKSRTLSSTSLE